VSYLLLALVTLVAVPGTALAFGNGIEERAVDEFGAWPAACAIYAGYPWLAVAAFHAFGSLLLRFRRSND
jgi:hypothetical protein